MVEEKISSDDLNVLINYKTQSETKLLLAQKVLAESKAADLEYKNQILRIFVKYALSLDDGFDDSTGVITRMPKIEEKENVES